MARLVFSVYLKPDNLGFRRSGFRIQGFRVWGVGFGASVRAEGLQFSRLDGVLA